MNPPIPTLEIRPAIGFGPVTFGATQDEVRRLLGEPDAVLEVASPDSPQLTWSYARLGLKAIFARDELAVMQSFARFGHNTYSPSFAELILGHLSVENPEAELFGYRLIGKTEQSVRAVLGTFDLGSAKDTVTYSGESKFTWLSFDKTSMTFELVDGKLKNIKYSRIVTEEGLPSK